MPLSSPGSIRQSFPTWIWQPYPRVPPVAGGEQRPGTLSGLHPVENKNGFHHCRRRILCTGRLIITPPPPNRNLAQPRVSSHPGFLRRFCLERVDFLTRSLFPNGTRSPPCRLSLGSPPPSPAPASPSRRSVLLPVLEEDHLRITMGNHVGKRDPSAEKLKNSEAQVEEAENKASPKAANLTQQTSEDNEVFETQLPGTGPLESPAAPDVDSDSGASTNIDFIPGTQEEEQPRVLGPPARRRRIQIQDEVLSDEEEEPPLAPGSPPPRGALPAEERLTRERGRLRRVSVLTSVGERLLEHCYEESRRAAAADQAMLTLIAQEGRKLRAVLRETNQILREGVEEVRLIRRLMERAVAVMERAYPPQIAPPPPPTPTPPLPAPTPPTPSQNASTQTRRRTILGKRKIKPADKYSPS
ncbi:uncharacterized protein MBP isoform X5 [Paroedura picta]|uniref:uncharacterized protein MBP isoform X5 n=1 Tax=Paroedura picta TaxID=143630 RepID=UPI0040561A59